MKYIDDEDLLNEDFEISKYKIAHILNDLSKEIEELKERIHRLEYPSD